VRGNDGVIQPALWVWKQASPGPEKLKTHVAPQGARIIEAPLATGAYLLFPGDRGDFSVLGPSSSEGEFEDESWSYAEPPQPRNPDLSWEYWDGNSWWQIKGINDGTLNFSQTGDVVFCVPRNLQASDVVGRTNLWVRARLVGGDYGQ